MGLHTVHKVIKGIKVTKVHNVHTFVAKYTLTAMKSPAIMTLNVEGGLI